MNILDLAKVIVGSIEEQIAWFQGRSLLSLNPEVLSVPDELQNFPMCRINTGKSPRLLLKLVSNHFGRKDI